MKTKILFFTIAFSLCTLHKASAQAAAVESGNENGVSHRILSENPGHYAFTVSGNSETADYTTDPSTILTVMSENLFNVTGEVSGSGSVTPSDTAVASGEQVKFTATPEEGHQFLRWSDGNYTNPRTFTITKDTTLKARFVTEGLSTSLIDIRPNNDTMGSIVNTYGIGGEVGGTVGGGHDDDVWGYDGPSRYAHGEAFEFQAQPANGYHFVGWEINGIQIKPGSEVPNGWDEFSVNYPVQHISVEKHLTIIARFVSDEDFPNYASLLVFRSNNDAGGKIVSNVKHYTDSGMYLKGDAFEIQAQPKQGYRFVRWERDDIPVDDYGDIPERHIIVNEPLNLTAVFAQEGKRLITLHRNREDWGTVSGAGDYVPDTDVQIRANAAAGFQFVQWSDGNTDNSRTVTVTEDLFFTAEFWQFPLPVPGEGSGTEEDPYWISSKDDMELLAGNVYAGENYSGVYFRLTRNLTGADDTLTTSVGHNRNTACFSGIFDGDEHEIAVKTTGIFGRIQGATIKNLGVTGKIHTYYSPSLSAGGICAVAENSTIINCHNNAEIAVSLTSGSNQMSCGGICGLTTDSYIVNCHNTGNISAVAATHSYSGGIAGRYAGGGTIANCYNTGNIAASSVYDPSYCGGISGNGEGAREVEEEGGGVVITEEAGAITNCYNTGSIFASSSPSYCGGISGEGGAITNCYNTGSIAAAANVESYLGGICGRNGTVGNCFVANMQITTGTNSRTSGRIGSGDGSYADCYASAVTLNGNSTSGTDKDGKDGQDITRTSLQNQSWLTTTLGWNFTYNWHMRSNGTWPEPKEVQLFAVRGEVSESSADMGTVTVSDTIALTGASVEFTATPIEDYQFVQWEEDGSDENPRTVTVTKDTTLTAVFKQITFQVYGTVNESSVGMGEVTPSDTLVAPNQPVEFTATPAEWHRFVRWEEDDSDENPRTVMITEDLTFTAEFAQMIFQVYGRISESSTDMGNVTPSDMLVPGGTSVVFTATPHLSAGYKFVKWEENGSDKNPDTVTVTQDTTLTALFEKMQLAVRGAVSRGSLGMGTVTPSATSVAWGEQVVFTATPADGHHFVKWQEDGNMETPRTVRVTQDTTLTAVFAAGTTPKYKLTLLHTPEDGGTVSANGEEVSDPKEYTLGDKVEIEAGPAEGYHFVQWQEDGNRVNPRTITIAQDTTFTAVFEEGTAPKYQLTLLQSPEGGGTVSGAGEYTLGQEAAIRADPAEGYYFVQWQEDGSRENPRTITLTQNTTFTAMFAAGTAPKCRVTLRANEAAMGTLKGDGEFAQNTQTVIRAVGKGNYSFVRWNDGDKTTPRTITVYKDTTFTAVFGYEIELRTNVPNVGEVTGAGSYEIGTTVEIRAIPAEGYRFVQWQDNITDNPRTITVNEKKTYTASFGTSPSGNMTEIASSDGGVVLYPNPVRNVLHFRSAAALERIGIYNLSGQQVKHFASPGTEVNVSDLPRGLYFVRLITADGNESVRKMVKE